MKKNHILFAGLIFLFALLLCTAAAADPLSREEVEARLAEGGTITEEERMEILNANLGDDIPTDVGLGRDVTVSADGGKYRILLSALPFTVEFPNSKQTVELKLKDTWMEVAEDAVLIQEKSSGWFTGGTSLSLSSGCTVYGSTPLKEGVPVLILGTDGFLHAYYAGNGTNNSTLTLGEKINYLRGIRAGHLETDIGPTFPILPWGTLWPNGSISTGLEGTFSIHYDVDFDIHIWGTELFIRDNSFEVALKDVTLELTDDSTLDGVTIPIFTFSEEVVYVLSVSGGVNVYVSGGGKGKTVFDTNIREGYGCTVTLYGDVFPVFDDWSWNHDANFDITSSNQRGEVYVAYGYGADVKFIEILGVGASYKTGVVVGGETAKNHEYPGDTERKFWHECEDDECVNGSAFWRLGPISLECIIGPYSAPIAEIAKKDFDPFKEYYASDTFHDQSMTSPCPHKGYRLNVEVVTDTGEKIPGASVFYSPYTEHYAGAMNKETDSEGKAVLYAPKAQIDITAIAYSKLDPDIVVNRTESLEKTEDVQDLQIVLEIPVKHLRFVNSAAGEATGWPNDIDFKPFFSEEVQIPDTVPALSGRVFTGWNTKEDGSGTSYMPGTKLTLKDDLTLWAQWQIAGDDWYVIYNANGGTKAPEPQIVRKGRDAVLTAELPEGGKLIFKGWTPDKQHPETVYQPGDTLKYDSEKDVVVLYALWDLSPVPEPIHISFDANGVQDAALPADAWFETGTWMQLEPAYAPVGSALTFLGWSEDPDAEEPEYQAGQSYYFFRDTQLFAVWDKLDSLTLTFRDSLPGAASGIPEPITVLPSMSPYVHIPDQIPEKSGRVFTGWNTKKDGSGTGYAPGSVMTLRKNAVLWAQWRIAGDDWYVIYNANGGTKAPEPQIIPKGRDAVLTAERPEGGKMIFKGWTPDPQAMDPVYQPGDTLKYDSETNVVVLYALWNLSPVPEPVHISFSANGAEKAVVPADVWCETGTWLQLEPAFAPLESPLVFLGWSEDPGAEEPEFQAGKSYYFYRDTHLFAVWDKMDSITLTFLDSLPDAASGIPEPITILPSMSPYVHIPDQVPEKSGRVFTGWNTKKDGSGARYAPGSVMTLRKSAVLWAQWQIAGDSWYVIYNANGGTKAPAAQDVPLGEDAVLTTELPENGALAFRGWTPDPQAMDPVYQPGDTLKYDSGKRFVVLYALWDLSPAERPVLITFRANGGDPDTVPDPISRPKLTWFLLPESEPVWDAQHLFLGWSDNPEAAEAKWKAGAAAVFDRDTTLYAVWNARYKVISGAGSVWVRKSKITLRFIADGDIRYFTELRIDGERFTKGVEISSSSTVADIRPWALETLAVGTHTITFQYEDGEASASFTIQKALPPTGDQSNPALWLFLILFGLAGITLVGVLAHSAKKKR